MGWATANAALGVLLTVMLGHLFACDLVLCNATLHTVPEPKGWSEWPILHDLGGYAIKGRWGIPTYQLYFHDTELRDSGLCPRGGVSLDAWFKEGPLTRGPQDVQLRAKDGTFIASATSKAEGSPGEPTFIVAFRRSAEKELAFALPEDRTIAVLLGIGLLGLLVAGGLARRALATAAAYRDPTRYRGGNPHAAASRVQERPPSREMTSWISSPISALAIMTRLDSSIN